MTALVHKTLPKSVKAKLPPFRWTERSEEAAQLLAEDRLTDEQIAARAEVSRRSLATWKKHPEFAQRVAEEVETFRQRVREVGIAIRENRLASVNDRWRALHRIVDARAVEAIATVAENEKILADTPEPLKAEIARKLEYIAPGMDTGLVVRKETPTKFGTIVEHSVDTGLLAEMRALEMQAAKELGQIIEKRDLTTGGKPLNRPNLRRLSTEKLDELDALLAEAEDDDPNSD